MEVVKVAPVEIVRKTVMTVTKAALMRNNNEIMKVKMAIAL